MADKKKTLSAIFSATDKMSPVVKKIATEGKAAAKEIKELQETTKKGITANALEKDINSISSAVDKMEDKVKSVGNTFEDGFDSAADALEATSDKVEDFGDNVEKTKKQTEGFGDDFDKVSKQTKSFGDDIEGVGNKLDKMGSIAGKVKGVIAGLGIAASASKVYSAISDYAEASMEDYTNFQKGTSEVKTLLAGSSEAELAAIDTGTKQFAMDNAMLTSDVTPALYNAISAGVDKSEAFDFLGDANKLAVGGVAELNDSVAVLTTITNNYKDAGLQASAASDLLFTTVKKGVTTIPELASSLGEVVPAAAASNVAFSDVTAGMATLTASLGAGSTTKAVTKFRGMFDELSKTGTEVDKTFRSIAGKGFNDFIAEGHNLQDALVLLNDYAEKNNVSIKELFSSVEAGSAALILGSTGAKKFAENMEAMEHVAGATTTAYETMQDTEMYEDKQIEALQEHMRLSVGEIMADATDPFDKALIEHIPELEETVTGFFEGVGDFVHTLGEGFDFILDHGTEVKTILSGITAAVATKVVVSNASTFMSVLSKGITGLIGSVSGLVNPVTLAVGGVVALGVGIHEVKKHLDQSDLEKHFGDITLSLEEANEMAREILGSEMIDRIEASAQAWETVSAAVEDLEDTASNIERMNFDLSLGYTDVPQEEYAAEIDNYIQGSLDLLRDKQYAVHLNFEALFGEGETADKFTENANTLYADLEGKLTQYGKDLQQAVVNAYESGWDVDTTEAVEGILKSISDIDAQLAEAQSEAKLEAIKLDFVSSDLSPESFQLLQDSLNEETEKIKQQLEENRINAIAEYNLEFKAGEINQEELQESIETAQQAYEDGLASIEVNNLNFQTEAIVEAYEDEINAALPGFSEKLEAGMQLELDKMSTNPNYQVDFSFLEASLSNGIDEMDGSVQRNISKLFEKMKPSQEALFELADAYTEAGRELPSYLHNALSESSMIGTIANDARSITQVVGNAMSKNDAAYGEAINKIRDAGEGYAIAYQTAVNGKTEEVSDTMKSFAQTTRTSLINELEKPISITIPAKVNLDTSASGSIGVTVAENAIGGIYDSPLLTWVAEAGDREAIIPLNDTQRAYDLWQEAGAEIGRARGYDFIGNAFNGAANFTSTENTFSRSEKSLVLRLEGGGEIKIPQALSKQDIVNMMIENIKPILMDILSQEIFEEGDGVYDI